MAWARLPPRSVSFTCKCCSRKFANRPTDARTRQAVTLDTLWAKSNLVTCRMGNWAGQEWLRKLTIRWTGAKSSEIRQRCWPKKGTASNNQSRPLAISLPSPTRDAQTSPSIVRAKRRGAFVTGASRLDGGVRLCRPRERVG